MRRASIPDSSTNSPRSKSRVSNLRHTIHNQLNDPTPQDSFWWSATDGRVVIEDAAPTKEQAVAAIVDEFRLGAIRRLKLAKCHILEVHGWKIALQKPKESSDKFLDRTCGQKKNGVRPLPVADRRSRQQTDATQARL